MELRTKKIIAREGLILLFSIVAIWIYVMFRRDARFLEIAGFWVLTNLVIRFIFWSVKTLLKKK